MMKQNKQRDTLFTVNTFEENWSVQRRMFRLEMSLSIGKLHLTQYEQNTIKRQEDFFFFLQL